MSKPNKLVQLFVIVTTAYSLYRIVSDFLETDTGQNVKSMASDYLDQGKSKAADYYETAKTKVTDYVDEMLSDMPEAKKAVDEVAGNV